MDYLTHAQDRARHLSLAIKDLSEGLANWRLWMLAAMNDVRHRYRRSTIGPFWASLSTLVQTLVTGFVLSFLFKSPVDKFLPFICIGLVIWGVLTNTVNEGANSFIVASEAILQVKLPLSIYIWQTIWRNLMIGAHTIIVFFAVAFIFGLFPTITYIFALPGLVLFVANVAWMTLFAAVLSARFRDVPLIVLNTFTMLFWLTPIFYMPEQIGGEILYIVMANPMFHIIEIVRAPLLLKEPTLVNWAVALGAAAFGWFVTILLYARTRTRIPFWL
jgi:lipopolysaccharide transport system permease protein